MLSDVGIRKKQRKGKSKKHADPTIKRELEYFPPFTLRTIRSRTIHIHHLLPWWSQPCPNAIWTPENRWEKEQGEKKRKKEKSVLIFPT
jgi:hypothetical protein